MSRRAAVGSFLTRVKSISVTRSPAATNPGFNPAAFMAPRKNNPAAKSNMSESAICAMTEIWRAQKAAQASEARRLAHLLFEVVNQVGFRRFERRTEAEDKCGNETKCERDREHAEIRRKIDDERDVHVVEQCRERMEQEIVAPNAQDEPDCAAADREQQTFGEQLPNDSPARRADGEPHRDFPGARGAARQQHVCQV